MDDYDGFIEKFRAATGIDLNSYKRPQMERRLTTLRNKRGFDRFSDYLAAALRDRTLLDELLDRMTINVSEFFRNRPRWDALQSRIPALAPNRGLRAWSAACSTGEEPYTLLLLAAGMGRLEGIEAWATDIDERALATAREGVYRDESLAGVPAGLRSRYFRPAGAETSQIVPEIRDRVRFEKQNLLTDAFGVGWDLIICRNVLIYFTDSAKDLLYRKFAAALRPGGILFIGSTEQVFRPDQYGLRPLEAFFYERA